MLLVCRPCSKMNFKAKLKPCGKVHCEAILSYQLTQKHLPILANKAILKGREADEFRDLGSFRRCRKTANKRNQQVTLHNFPPSDIEQIMWSCFGITHNTGTFSHLDAKIILMWWKLISHLGTRLIVWAIMNSLSALKKYEKLNKKTKTQRPKLRNM